MDWFAVGMACALVGALFGLRRWRRARLAAALASLSPAERRVIAGSPWFTPPPANTLSGALPGYARLYHRSLWPMRVTVATGLVLMTVLAIMIDRGLW